MLTFTGFNWREDGRKVLLAALGGAAAVVVSELSSPAGIQFTRVFLGLVIGGAFRGILAIFEIPSVPANQIALVKHDADKDNVQKVVEQVAVTKPYVQPEDVKAAPGK